MTYGQRYFQINHAANFYLNEIAETMRDLPSRHPIKIKAFLAGVACSVLEFYFEDKLLILYYKVQAKNNVAGFRTVEINSNDGNETISEIEHEHFYFEVDIEGDVFVYPDRRKTLDLNEDYIEKLENHFQMFKAK